MINAESSLATNFEAQSLFVMQAVRPGISVSQLAPNKSSIHQKQVKSVAPRGKVSVNMMLQSGSFSSANKPNFGTTFGRKTGLDSQSVSMRSSNARSGAVSMAMSSDPLKGTSQSNRYMGLNSTDQARYRSIAPSMNINSLPSGQVKFGATPPDVMGSVVPEGLEKNNFYSSIDGSGSFDEVFYDITGKETSMSGSVDEEHMDKQMDQQKEDKKRNPMSTIKELAQKKDVSNVLKKYNELFVESGILERIIPRKVNTPEELKEWNKYVLRNDKEYAETDIDAINDGLLELIYDLLDRGGKRWRPVLGMIYAECLGRNVADAIMIGSHQHDDILFACGLTEFVHNGSLMIDDVEDKSLMRRGQPCTYLKYGDDYAVNTGTIMYCVPIMKIDEFIKDDDALKFQMYKTCCEETANLHFGQNWDIHWHNGHKMPSEEQYLHMIINKTSVLPRLCVRLIARIMEEDCTEMVYYVEQLGAAFQIQDDLIAIKSDIYAKERGILAEDIHEGKRTLIVSHAYCKSNMITAAEKERLLEILDMGTKDEKILREAVDILNRSGAVEYAEMRAKSMLEEAWARVDKSLPNNSGKHKLKQLSNFLINRDL